MRVLLVLVLAGCASAQPNARLEREIQELRRRTDGDRHAMHELENRVFILEDKLDTAEVARDKTSAMPTLPVVTKRAPVAETEPQAEPPAAEPESESNGDTEEEGRRPPIVIHVDSRGRSSPAGPRAVPPIDLAQVTEKLPVVPMPKRPAAAPAAGDDAMVTYKTAYEALSRHEHAVAIQGFRGFLAKWPAHDYADNALYWLGEAYYDQADFQTALTEFRALVKRYPMGNKAPDALLKVGFCMSKLGDGAGARDVLTQVVDIYPKTDAARLATQRLAELSGR